MDEGTSSSSSPSATTPEADTLQDVIGALCAALATTDLDYDSKGRPIVVAKLDYDPAEDKAGVGSNSDYDSRLCLTRGDSVHVVNTSMDKGWWWVEVCGRTGYVPASYLCTESELRRETDLGWQDTEYFSQYSKVKIHQEMLADEPRTLAYQRAIQQSRAHIKGKVVLDVGCGTGILSLLCVRDGGAARVYAVEASPIAKEAKRIVDQNGYADQITVLHGKVEDVDIPEQVDLIVSEWMGTFLLFELMLEAVITARDLFLKPDGVLWPSDASLYLVPCMAANQAQRISFWKSIYGFDFSPLQESARSEYHRVPIYNHELKPSDCLSEAQEIMRLSLKATAVEDIDAHSEAFEFTIQQDGTLHGFASWFDVAFGGLGTLPSEDAVNLSTGPESPRTHWNQDLCMLDDYITVWTGDVITGSVAITRNAEWRRHLHVAIDFVVYREGEVVARAAKDFGLWKV